LADQLVDPIPAVNLQRQITSALVVASTMSSRDGRQ
jgi:hypothetical protein